MSTDSIDAPSKSNWSLKRKELWKQARSVTDSPGVYLMKSSAGDILYVGKAKNLKNRVSSYFQSEEHESPRINILIRQIEIFELILTETESEALILECTLIKKYRPKFNIRLKDDKTYPYLKISQEHDFPRIEWTRKILKDSSQYFGPFPSSWSARQVLHMLNETFKLRDCSENTFSHRSRPCILYQMEKCTAPCVGYVNKKEYAGQLLSAQEILEGKGDALLKDLNEKMQRASEELEYEKAAFLRDQLKNLELVTQTQGVHRAGLHVECDLIASAQSESHAFAVVLMIRAGKLIGVKHFQIQNTQGGMKESELIYEFLSLYYGAEFAETKNLQVHEVLVAHEVGDKELFEKTFGIQIKTPADVQSKEERQLLQVAKANVEHSVEQSKKKEKDHGLLSLEETQNHLQLIKLPHRIECYDISNIQGEDAVASRVVFIDGASDKNLYRRYKIKTVEGANDFAMMKEVLGRRFSRTDEALPDLVLVDGGIGQLNQAVAILEELNIQGVEVVGLAKARTQSDFSAKDVKVTSERIFIPGRKNPVVLKPGTRVFGLLTHLRDEAHRFAVSYHKVVRKKRVIPK